MSGFEIGIEIGAFNEELNKIEIGFEQGFLDMTPRTVNFETSSTYPSAVEIQEIIQEIGNLTIMYHDVLRNDIAFIRKEGERLVALDQELGRQKIRDLTGHGI